MTQEWDVSRVEEKYPMTRREAEYMIGRLKKALAGDEVNGYQPYMVRSLYFDSFYNDDFFDKIDGARDRKKIRLRVYSLESAYAKLEVKQKLGNNQHKHSVSVTREQAAQLSAGYCDFLQELEEATAQDIWCAFQKELYRPGTLIEYSRVAFSGGMNDIRITFDYDIRATEGRADLFKTPSSALYPLTKPGTVVMEVKYNHFLPSYIKTLLSAADRPQQYYSKYILGRNYGLG